MPCGGRGRPRASPSPGSGGGGGEDAGDTLFKVDYRFSPGKVFHVVEQLSPEQQELVRSIGFGGLLDLPRYDKLDRHFAAWLFNQVDAATASMADSAGARAPITARDVHEVLGVPLGGRDVAPGRAAGAGADAEEWDLVPAVRRLLGLEPREELTLKHAKNVLDGLARPSSSSSRKCLLATEDYQEQSMNPPAPPDASISNRIWGPGPRPNCAESKQQDECMLVLRHEYEDYLQFKRFMQMKKNSEISFGPNVNTCSGGRNQVAQHLPLDEVERQSHGTECNSTSSGLLGPNALDSIECNANAGGTPIPAVYGSSDRGKSFLMSDNPTTALDFSSANRTPCVQDWLNPETIVAKKPRTRLASPSKETRKSKFHIEEATGGQASHYRMMQADLPSSGYVNQLHRNAFRACLLGDLAGSLLPGRRHPKLDAWERCLSQAAAADQVVGTSETNSHPYAAVIIDLEDQPDECGMASEADKGKKYVDTDNRGMASEKGKKYVNACIKWVWIVHNKPTPIEATGETIRSQFFCGNSLEPDICNLMLRCFRELDDKNSIGLAARKQPDYCGITCCSIHVLWPTHHLRCKAL
ncbi:hypothetical protein EJB05_30412, partial [Eragrostis curvula]